MNAAPVAGISFYSALADPSDQNAILAYGSCQQMGNAAGFAADKLGFTQCAGKGMPGRLCGERIRCGKLGEYEPSWQV
jgi:glycine cleavage system pyridoxal-binding protein P